MAGPKSTKQTKSTASKAAPQETMTKADAVRAAIAQGYDMPARGVDYIKATFGIDVPRQQFSVYKSDFKKREGKAPKIKSARPAAGYLAPPSKGPKAGGPDVLMAVEAIKPLIDQYGAERVKRIVDLLG